MIAEHQPARRRPAPPPAAPAAARPGIRGSLGLTRSIGVLISALHAREGAQTAGRVGAAATTARVVGQARLEAAAHDRPHRQRDDRVHDHAQHDLAQQLEADRGVHAEQELHQRVAHGGGGRGGRAHQQRRERGLGVAQLAQTPAPVADEREDQARSRPASAPAPDRRAGRPRSRSRLRSSSRTAARRRPPRAETDRSRRRTPGPPRRRRSGRTRRPPRARAIRASSEPESVIRRSPSRSRRADRFAAGRRPSAPAWRSAGWPARLVRRAGLLPWRVVSTCTTSRLCRSASGMHVDRLVRAFFVHRAHLPDRDPRRIQRVVGAGDRPGGDDVFAAA